MKAYQKLTPFLVGCFLAKSYNDDAQVSDALCNNTCPGSQYDKENTCGKNLCPVG